jgi:aminomethyltransferase
VAYILNKDLEFYSKHDTTSRDFEDFNAAWENYYSYLRSLEGKIPKSAYEFANAEWHYKTSDARCPHDAWLEELRIGEVEEQSGKFELKPIEIYVRLLGAYHDGHLEFIYKNIHQYSMNSERDFLLSKHKGGFYHHDWMRDEIRLSEDGFVIHEIEWLNARWIIECEDIECKWIPFDPDKLTDMDEIRRIEYMEAQKITDKAIYEEIRNGGVGFYKQPTQGIIEVSGGEAVQFLNGLITNDVQKLEENSWMLAAFPNAKGRLLSIVRVIRQKEKFLFVTEQETYQQTLDNLNRFTLAGDFKVNDLTEKAIVLSLIGRGSRELLNRVLKAELSNLSNSEIFHTKYGGATIRILSSIRGDGFDIIAPLQQGTQMAEELKLNECVKFSPMLYETLRIENGIPRHGIDIDEETVVPEAGLEGLISYNKGCYIGQEVIARIHFRGHVAKQLTGLVFEELSEPSAVADGLIGAEIKSLDDKNAGKITSVTFSPKLGKVIALAYVRYAYLTEGTKLFVNDFGAKVSSLPFLK